MSLRSAALLAGLTLAGATSSVACSGERFESAGTGGGATGGVGGTGATGGAGGSGATGGSGGTNLGGSGGTAGAAGSGGTSATGGAAGSSGTGGASGCPTGLPGPPMLKIEPPTASAYCIDTLEAPSASYSKFLSATNKPAQPSYCSWNTDFTPQSGWPPAAQDLPVLSIDWCDAWSYCAWAGKRLCGKIGGGPSGYNDEGSLTDEWYFACSGGGTTTYSYGNTFATGACNTSESGLGAPVAVGSTKTCKGGFPGLFDMSGNVGEWVDACDGQTGEGDKCHDRSGSFTIDQSSSPCAYTWSDARNSSFPDVGVRCCADPL